MWLQLFYLDLWQRFHLHIVTSKYVHNSSLKSTTNSCIFIKNHFYLAYLPLPFDDSYLGCYLCLGCIPKARCSRKKKLVRKVRPSFLLVLLDIDPSGPPRKWNGFIELARVHLIQWHLRYPRSTAAKKSVGLLLYTSYISHWRVFTFSQERRPKEIIKRWLRRTGI